MIKNLAEYAPRKTSIPEEAVLVEGSLQGGLAFTLSQIPIRQYVVINCRLAIVFAAALNEITYRYVCADAKLSDPFRKMVKVYPFLGSLVLPAALKKIP